MKSVQNIVEVGSIKLPYQKNAHSQAFAEGFEEGLFGKSTDSAKVRKCNKKQADEWLDGWVSGSLIKTSLELIDLDSCAACDEEQAQPGNQI
ncbi:MAG: hypothetical protein ABW116_09790 [Candidatus Sedimenticola sp. 20ELBAFRAG]